MNKTLLRLKLARFTSELQAYPKKTGNDRKNFSRAVERDKSY